MAECTDLRILEKISAEVDEAQVKIILSSQCIKAQIFLVDRLRKEAAKQKEACKYISSGNCKLEAEIKHAEQELTSLMAAHDTIRSARVEIKKELLLARERKADTAKRVELGQKKYEDLWTQCKKRYESIPFVQKWFELTNKTLELKDRVKTLDQEAVAVVQEIRKKKEALQHLDNTRIIELAKYIIHDRPKMTKELTQKTETCRKVTAEIAQFLKEEEAKAKALVSHKETSEEPSNTKVLLDGYWPSLREHFSDDKDSLQVPKLLMPAKDLDIFTANLEQIKRHANTPTKSDIFKTLPEDTKSPNTAANKDDICGTSSFFNKSYLNTHEPEDETGTETEPKNIAKRRLVNMLEDLNIKKGKTKNDASNVNPTVMQVDNVIQKRYTITTSGEMSKIQGVHKQNDDMMEREEIEEIDMTPSASNAILDPPTPFLDMTQITNYGSLQHVEVIVHQTKDDAAAISQKLKASQESNEKKRVSFDLPVIQEVPEEVASAEADEDKVDEANVSSYSLSAGDESFNKMKEMILKKNYLDLSPDFVYAKQPKDTRVVTSKFFKNDTLKSVTDKPQPEHQDKNMEVDKPEDGDNSFGNKDEGKLEEQLTVATPNTTYDDVIDCSKNDETKKSDNFVTGLLFNHGPNGIPDSLDVSMNTTGFDDGDGDFSHGIDSSLLLSPKADIPAAISGETSEVFSQEVPNFLSGLRKTGFSFFGASASTDAKPDSVAASQGNNFNFNFGSDNKKNRGGLFSMFQ